MPRWVPVNGQPVDQSPLQIEAAVVEAYAVAIVVKY